MKLYLGDQKIHIYPRFLKCIGSGKEGKVYIYNGQALKILYDKPYPDSMNSFTCVRLKNIETRRILLPREILLDKNGEFKGYDTKYIGSSKSVYDITKEKFIHEINELRKEIEILTDYRIVINDWNFTNFIFDGRFRLVDPGLYKYKKKETKEKIQKENYCVLRDFIFFELLKQKMISEMDEYMKWLNESFENSEENIVDFFESEMDEKETINQYIKRIAQPNHFVI